MASLVMVLTLLGIGSETAGLSLSISLGVGTAGTSFMTFSLGNNTYHFSDVEKGNYHDVQTRCEEEGWTLAFFDTNNEYYQVRDNIKSMVDTGAIGTPLSVYVRFSAEPKGSQYNFGWGIQSFKTDVWYISTSSPEPNDDCSQVVSDVECCGIIAYNSSGCGLRDTPRPCDEFQANYLCMDPKPVLVNECSDGSHICEQICHDTDATYTCSCHDGFILNPDNKTCSDTDDCLQEIDHCSHACVNNEGGYECFCPFGSTLLPDNQTCFFFNQCLLDPCSANQRCTDEGQGYYRCDCIDGYLPDPGDVHNCVDKNECDYPKLCARNAECINSEGSFECVCRSGYLGDGKTLCQDIDECMADTDFCDQDCTNTEGSYLCSCQEGFELDSNNHTCLDIDECSGDEHNCSQICYNQLGSYSCRCTTGYEVDGDNMNCLRELPNVTLDNIQEKNRTCLGVYECSNPDRELSNMTLDNVQEKNRTCLGVNECSNPERKLSNVTLDNVQDKNRTCLGVSECSNPERELSNVTLENVYEKNTICLCVKECSRPGRELSNVTVGNVHETLASIRVNLLLNPKTVSLYIRTLVSVDDPRPSSQAVGSIGIVFLSCLLGFVLIMDCQRLVLFMKDRKTDHAKVLP